MDGASDSTKVSQGSPNVDSSDLNRIRQWMDQPDWDVLDDSSELSRDKEACVQLLEQGQWSSAEDLDELPNGSHPQELRVFQPSPRFTAPKFLGAGAFGIVFSVRDELLGMPVAIKMLRPSKSNSIELRMRFVGEAQSTASLCHASIVRVYDTGKMAGIPYFTCSLLEDGTLADRISKKGQPLSIRQSAWTIARVADSVHFAHSKAILHRDLKPSNILLKPCDLASSEQLGFEPILTDFGLAKRIGNSDSFKNITRDGRVLGTTRYMSPEQARGSLSEIGTTSDVFSLGTILYQLLTGTVPFDDHLDESVRYKIANTDPIPPRRIDKSIPRDLEAVALKCLAKNPADRYQTARELRLDLERFLRNEPVEAKRSTLLRRGSFLVRKHPLVATLLAGAVAGNCFALANLTHSLQKERQAREIERVAKQSELSAKNREQIALAEIVSIYSDLADQVFAGARIKDDVMLASLQKSVKIVEDYIDENPNNERILHCLSVLKHFESTAFQRFGQADKYIASREKVVQILDVLLSKKPGDRVYRFQRFFSQLLLGEWLANTPELKLSDSSITGEKLLETAHEEIRKLANEFPENVDYQDAFAAAKLNIASLIAADTEHGRNLIEESIAISKQLWQQHPDRPLLAKHAIRGLIELVQFELRRCNYQQAYVECERALALYRDAWAPLQEELWVERELFRLLTIRCTTLIANDKLDEAIETLDELDRNLETLRTDIPFNLYVLRSIFETGLTRFQVAELMSDEAAAKDAIDRLLNIVEEYRSVPDFMSEIRSVATGCSIPREVQRRLKDETEGYAN